MLIAIIVGTRPQIIKAWPLQIALEKAGHETLLFDTHQHYDDNMNSSIFKELGFKPDFISPDLTTVDKKFNMVVNIGDTDTALAGALQANKAGVRSCHVEAGCRCGKWIKEEWNRQLIDQLSDICFAPTAQCMINLTREEVKAQCYLTGDVLLDAFLKEDPNPHNTDIPYDYVFLTLHRRENQDESKILDAIWKARVLGKVIFPVHPHTRQNLPSMNIPGVKLIDPLPYFDTRKYIKCANYVATDSGGVQREACFAGKECLLLRDETEWPECLEENVKAFGDGHAADKIADLITS